ncbi:hypothetical protein L6452_32987 [Arctium lappa]|uniref:Uncharacterized protein n=1 Tax=Arctium lappa TaxID=4217 RepID=A0ACB8Z625_ARCLA|nr:hypothetical protein L6452_32987 [Arctium lappa]
MEFPELGEGQFIAASDLAAPPQQNPYRNHPETENVKKTRNVRSVGPKELPESTTTVLGLDTKSLNSRSEDDKSIRLENLKAELNKSSVSEGRWISSN